MNKLMIIAASTLIMAAASPAFSANTDGVCGTVAGQWMSKDTAKKKAVEAGYDARRVTPENGCLEIYAIDKNGARVELYMHPVSGEIVKTKKKS